MTVLPRLGGWAVPRVRPIGLVAGFGASLLPAGGRRAAAWPCLTLRSPGDGRLGRFYLSAVILKNGFYLLVLKREERGKRRIVPPIGAFIG